MESQNRQGATQFDHKNVGAFLAVVIQLGLLLLVVDFFRVEELSGFVKLSPVIFIGFIIHALIPQRLRPLSFCLLFLASVSVVLGPTLGVRLVVIGLVLIGICHLPIPFWARVATLISAGIALAALRVGWPYESWSAPKILPILGAIFMFRLIVYLYDLRHEKKPATIWQRLSYFFLFPNVVFPLFPVVDYATFRRTYYDSQPSQIYQKGLRWMLRGIIHLVIYRILYYNVIPSPLDIEDLGGLALFMASTYLLYLRISGQFHLIVGCLCLFGFNLPETHHRYFLASGFNDLWRRINIYWKDFLMKVFYYPIFYKVRKRGMTEGLVVSTMLVFITSWFLHSFQWFWLRGSFPLTVQDGVFWIVFGVLVVINTLYEAKRGRRATLKKRGWTLAGAATISLKTVGMFVFMCVFWSFWTSVSPSEWFSLLSVAASNTSGIKMVVLVLVAAVTIGVIVQYLSSKDWTSVREMRPSLATSPAIVGGGALFLLMIGQPTIYGHLGARTASLVESLKEDRLNQRDTQLLTRGYYEELLEKPDLISQLWRVNAQKPPDWRNLQDTDVLRRTGDILLAELVPSSRTVFKRATLQINRWGMRDKDYEKEKPRATYRIALVGASTVMGSGVDNDEVFEALVEDRLNRESNGKLYENYEILNFGVGGYSLLEMVAATNRKVFSFDPDAVFLVAHPNEKERVINSFIRHIRQGTALPPYLRELQLLTGMSSDMDETEARRRIGPFVGAIILRGYRRIVEECRKRDITAVLLYFPLIEHDPSEELATELLGMAEEAGFVTLSLRGTYEGFSLGSLVLAPWDNHPNVKGHRLIADRLYQLLIDNSESLGLGLTEQTGAIQARPRTQTE